TPKFHFAVYVNGGNGNDSITGSAVGDYIECTLGADVITTGRGDNLIFIRNDDISGITITGDPFGHNSLLLDYTPFAGAKMSSNFDVGTGHNTISYAGKAVVCSGMEAANVQNAIDELDLALFDSTAGGPGGGSGGSVVVTHPLGSEFDTIDISPDPNPTSKQIPGRLKWQVINLKRGITESM